MRRLLPVAVSAVLLLGSASAVMAARDPIPVSGSDSMVGLLDPGSGWTSDGIEHVRGWTGLYDTTGGALFTGTSVVSANWNLDAGGNGTMWGTTVVTLTGGAGGWRETWVATWNGGIWAGWGVGHGFGSLEGMKLKFDVWATGFGQDAFEGFAFQPGG